MSQVDDGVVKVVELIGNPRPSSRTRALADAIRRALIGELMARAPATYETQVLELGELVGVTFDPEPVRGRAAVADPFGPVRAARLLIVATPTYKATYSGLLKIFLDQFSHGDLADAVAVPVAIAAAEEHRQSVQANLRDLLVELGASVPAPAVAVLEPELESRTVGDIAAEWVHRYGSVVADVLRHLAHEAQAVERR
ncbi:MAG: NADPH-dependent oxidoreductase [Streptosporangiales bacterium]|nr:NADPH-dependent oxidoreductase [Streptosporangiales bacterium]